LVDVVIAGLQWEICLDDTIVRGRNFEDMLGNLEQVFARLSRAGLNLKATKCQLFAKRVHFLGHVISEEGVATYPSQISVIRDWPTPKDVNELRSYLGLCSFYRRYIEQFSAKARCLQKGRKGQKFVWSPECQDAFMRLKEALTQAPILAHPDFSKPLILDTDASQGAIGAVLSQ
jgi:hypothetical protein